jgi:hypothetical protein
MIAKKETVYYTTTSKGRKIKHYGNPTPITTVKKGA